MFNEKRKILLYALKKTALNDVEGNIPSKMKSDNAAKDHCYTSPKRMRLVQRQFRIVIGPFFRDANL